MWVLKSGRNLLLKKQDQFKSECLDLKTAKKNPIKEIIMEASNTVITEFASSKNILSDVIANFFKKKLTLISNSRM